MTPKRPNNSRRPSIRHEKLLAEVLERRPVPHVADLLLRMDRMETQLARLVARLNKVIPARRTTIRLRVELRQLRAEHKKLYDLLSTENQTLFDDWKNSRQS